MTFGKTLGDVLTVSLLASCAVLVSAGLAQAGSLGADDGFDDPKVAREANPAKSMGEPARLVPKIPSPPGTVPTVATTSGVRVIPAAPVGSAAIAPPASPPLVPPPASPPVVPSPTSTPLDPSPGAVDLAARVQLPATPIATPHGGSGPWPYAPRLKLGYRRFPFSRVGAPSTATSTTGTTTTLGPTTPESFESLSIDLYPMSWYLRVGLSSQFGWETGAFNRTGDYFLAESASVGFQIPGRFTPFAEGLAGAGYMRRRQTDTTLPTAYWQLGIDVGVEVYVAGRAYASLAVGYLHPANLFLMQKSLMSVNLDTWSLKLGFGI